MSREPQAYPPPKKAYTAPRLVRYGDVRSLTHAGSNASPETMAMMMP
jgi:hypothetical protein